VRGQIQGCYSVSCGSSGTGETPLEPWVLTARPREREHPGAQINHSLFKSNKVYENSQIF